MVNMINKINFPFVDPPKKWLRDGGVELLYPNSRWYLEKGPITFFHHWLEDINTGLKGKLIPLQWAPEYIGVSRTSLLKRAKAGGLTVLSFKLVESSTNLLGKVKERDSRKQYDYLIISECIAWRDILRDRAERSKLKKGGD